jgi:hypothetical protein
MQEIRDFIYGPKEKQIAYLYGYPNNGKKPISLEFGKAEFLESQLKQPQGEYLYYEILGSNLWEFSKETVAPHIPPRQLQLSCNPMPWYAAMQVNPTSYFTVYGMSNLGGVWTLLWNAKPTIQEMKLLKSAAMYDQIIVCQYTPSIMCIEVCSMIINGGYVARYTH